jgi:hypothetical protein
MRTTVGPDDIEMFEEPLPDLLAAVSGIRPAPTGFHVVLEPFGIRSAQRLALSSVARGVVAALWPGELKAQAEYLYGQSLGTLVVAGGGSRLERSGEPASCIPQLGSCPTALLETRRRCRRIRPPLGESGDLTQVGASETDRSGRVRGRLALARAGINLPDLPYPLDDVLDAAVTAWSAMRYASGRGVALPEGLRDRMGAIWR